MIFTKIAADLDSNPKIRDAGRDGREVFLFALRKNAQHDFNGCVPLSYFKPRYLADQLMIDDVTAGHGLSRSVTAGLLTKTDDGYLISGWDDEWSKRPLTDAERKRRSREKINPTSELKDDKDFGHEMSRTESDSHACHALDKSREEESRGEKSRGEKKRAATPAPPGAQLGIDSFHEYFVRTHGGEKPSWEARDRKRMHELVRARGVDTVVKRISILESSPPKWPEPPWDLATLCTHFDKVAAPSSAVNNRNDGMADLLRMANGESL